DHRADRGCRQQRRREQPDREPDGTKSLRTLLHHVVAVLDRQDALEVLAHHDGAHDPGATSKDGLVVLMRGFRRQVAADQYVRGILRHLDHPPLHPDKPWAAWPRCDSACSSSSSRADRCGLMSNTTFFTVPVNANGFLSS